MSFKYRFGNEWLIDRWLFKGYSKGNKMAKKFMFLVANQGTNYKNEGSTII